MFIVGSQIRLLWIWNAWLSC